MFFLYLFGIHTVDGSEMEPRFSDGDLVLYLRIDKSYLSREVVVYEADGRERVGRIIAIPGDEVEIAGGEVSIDGYLVTENDIYESTPDYDGRLDYPIPLGEGEYFILADHREGAKDSRIFGPIAESQIHGKVVTAIRNSGF